MEVTNRRKYIETAFQKFSQVFSSQFCEIFKNNSFTEHHWTNASVLCRLKFGI